MTGASARACCCCCGPLSPAAGPALAGGMCRAQQVGARTGLSALCDGFLEGGLCAALAALSGRPLGQQSISGEISLLLLLQMRQMNSTMVFTGTAGQEFMTTDV